MNINKDGKVLYFSDEEIDNETNGQKKVFVTKRINGKESHVKVKESTPKANNKQEKIEEKKDYYSNNEIIISLKNNEVKKQNIKENKRKEPKHYEKTEPQNRKLNKNKKKNKKEKSKKIMVTVFSIIILSAIIIVFSLTAPIFNITNIKIEGNEKVASDTIISLSGLKKGENIFKFNNSIIEKIKENAYIQSVKISRELPGTINIKVEERKIKYQINLINSYVYIDKNGYILENSAEKKQVPVIARFKYR